MFRGNNDGYLFAADARTGKVLWQYQTGSSIDAPSATYMIGDRQYVVIPAESTFTAVALSTPPAR